MSTQKPTAAPADARRSGRLDVADGTLVVYSDLVCSFAHLAVYRLLRARRRLGLDNAVVLDHRAFPLELCNDEVNPRPGVDSEVAVVGRLEPEAGWQLWQSPDWTYPVTVLPALEAVQAAKAQSLFASEALDRALRVAFWAESRCIAQRHVILEVGAATGMVDVRALAEALDDGRARRSLIDQFHLARTGIVRCSPHVFLPDGTDVPNPGVEAHWEGEFGVGFPVIDHDNPDVYDDLLRRAAL